MISSGGFAWKLIALLDMNYISRIIVMVLLRKSISDSNMEMIKGYCQDSKMLARMIHYIRS